MRKKNILKAVVTMAVAFAFIMPVAAVANDGTKGIENYGYSYLKNIDITPPVIKEIAIGHSGPSELWNKTFGGTGYDNVGGGSSVQQTSDGGYFVAGEACSTVYTDIYLVKTNPSGGTIWTRTYSGARADMARSAQQTSDGGYVIAGSTSSIHPGRL